MLRKKIIIIILIALIVLATFSFFFIRSQNKTTDNSNGINVIAVNTNTQTDIDTDFDGVPDWEENLWPELDPNNPDSDNDGVSDFDYIREKKREATAERNRVLNIEQDLTESQKLGRGLYSMLLAAGEAGQTLDEESKDIISANAAEYVANISLAEKIYLKEDFTELEDSKENSLAYKNTMQDLFDRYPIKRSELELIFETIEDPKTSSPNVYEAYLKYEAYLLQLSEVELPFAITRRHIELTNSIANMKAIFQNLISTETLDEITLFASLAQISEIFDSTATALSKIELYFDIISDPKFFE